MQIDEYRQLKKDSIEGEFIEFYELWINELRNNKFLSHLDKYNSIENFSKEINNILSCINSKEMIDVNMIVKRYNKELKNYTINDKKIVDEFNYDILEANIVADELRKIGYELVKLFNGFDNEDTAIIPLNKIDDLKLIESKIK